LTHALYVLHMFGMDAPPTPAPAAATPNNATPNNATPADAALLLPRATYYQLVHTLRGVLPPPVTDTQEDLARRDLAAIAHIASLLPDNPDEANLAAQYVGASAQAFDCQRLARQHEDDPARMLQCIAQSARMMREAKGWRLALLRAQAARTARAADTAASDAATQVERRTLGLMADALAAAAPVPGESPRRNPVTEAERYALLHRKHATLIRRLGRLPDRREIGWLPPDVVHAIATGTTPGLCALDKQSRRPSTVGA